MGDRDHAEKEERIEKSTGLDGHELPQPKAGQARPRLGEGIQSGSVSSCTSE
jgi:hypothetical protein